LKVEEEIRDEINYCKVAIKNYYHSLEEGRIDKETASFAVEMYDNRLSALLWVLGEN